MRQSPVVEIHRARGGRRLARSAAFHHGVCPWCTWSPSCGSRGDDDPRRSPRHTQPDTNSKFGRGEGPRTALTRCVRGVGTAPPRNPLLHSHPRHSAPTARRSKNGSQVAGSGPMREFEGLPDPHTRCACRTTARLPSNARNLPEPHILPLPSLSARTSARQSHAHRTCARV